MKTRLIASALLVLSSASAFAHAAPSHELARQAMHERQLRQELRHDRQDFKQDARQLERDRARHADLLRAEQRARVQRRYAEAERLATQRHRLAAQIRLDERELRADARELQRDRQYLRGRI